MTDRDGERIEPIHKHIGKLLFSEDFTIKNISDTGLCLLTSQHINTNTIYRIELLNKEKKKAMLKVEAIWSMLRGTRKDKNDTFPVYEVGLKFVGMDDIEKKFVADYIQGAGLEPEAR